MTSITQPLRDEHRDLVKHIQHLCQTADLIEYAPVLRVLAQINEDYRFLTRQLIPHAQAEDIVLYPVIDQLLAAPEATAIMHRDHIEISTYIDDLAALRNELNAAGEFSHILANDLRRVLYGLYALISAHFAKEEEIYLPILDRGLQPDEAERMFAAMEQAAHEIKSQLHHN